MGDLFSRRGVVVPIVLGAAVALAGPMGRAVQRASHPTTTANVRVLASAPYDNVVGRPFRMQITVTNPRPTDVALRGVSQRLPAGFSYEPDSTHGSIYDDPYLDGNTLWWGGRFLIRGGDSFTLNFTVRPPDVPGVYLMRADAFPVDESVGVDRKYAAFHLTVAAPTELLADPLVYGPGGASTVPRLTARLTSRGKPVPGRLIHFAARHGLSYGGHLCTATTSTDGVASCSSVIYFAVALQAGGYTATYDMFNEPSPHLYLSSSDDAQIVTDIL